MLNSFPIAALVGAVLGFLSGLGIGGGSLLILWLTAVLGMDQAPARAINLLFFLPCAVIACLFRWKQGRLRWRVVLPAAICGCAAALLGSGIAQWMDVSILKKLFGGLLIVTGLRELCYRPRKS